MATVNSASLRDEFDAYKADIVSLRKEGEITEKTDKVLTGLCGPSDNPDCCPPRKEDQKDQHEFQHPSIVDRQG